MVVQAVEGSFEVFVFFVEGPDVRGYEVHVVLHKPLSETYCLRAIRQNGTYIITNPAIATGKVMFQIFPLRRRRRLGDRR